MTTIDTLRKLLEDAGLAEAAARFSPGGHAAETAALSTPAEARQALQDAVAEGFAAGWILFDEELVELSDGESRWDPEWDARLPLAAELANPETNQSIRLARNDPGWTRTTISQTDDAEGLLETTSHRRTGGGEIRHQVAWAPDSAGALRPASARLLPPS